MDGASGEAEGGGGWGDARPSPYRDRVPAPPVSFVVLYIVGINTSVLDLT